METRRRLDVFELADTAGEVRAFEFTIGDVPGLQSAELPPGFEPNPA